MLRQTKSLPQGHASNEVIELGLKFWPRGRGWRSMGTLLLLYSSWNLTASLEIPRECPKSGQKQRHGISLESFEFSLQWGFILNGGPFLWLRCLALGGAILHPGNVVYVPCPSLAGLTTTEKPEPGAPRFTWGEQAEPLTGREESVINYGRWKYEVKDPFWGPCELKRLTLWNRLETAQPLLKPAVNSKGHKVLWLGRLGIGWHLELMNCLGWELTRVQFFNYRTLSEHLSGPPTPSLNGYTLFVHSPLFLNHLIMWQQLFVIWKRKLPQNYCLPLETPALLPRWWHLINVGHACRPSPTPHPGLVWQQENISLWRGPALIQTGFKRHLHKSLEKSRIEFKTSAA